MSSEWLRKQNLICICNNVKELQKKRLDEFDVSYVELHQFSSRNIHDQLCFRLLVLSKYTSSW